MENKIAVIGAGVIKKEIVYDNVILIEGQESITNPYNDLPIIKVIDTPEKSGKEKRRERRKQERKAKKY